MVESLVLPQLLLAYADLRPSALTTRVSESGPLQDRQEAQLFEIIQRRGYDPGDFHWERSDDLGDLLNGRRVMQSGPPSQELIHSPSDYGFKIAHVDDHNPYSGRAKSHRIEFAPGREFQEEQHSGLDWENVQRAFALWLDIVHEEYTTENPWDQLEREEPRGFLSSRTSELPEDEPFSPEERAAVDQRLSDLEERIRSLRDLHEGEVEDLRHELDSLRSELDSLGKRKWADLAMMRIFRILLDLDIEPAQLHESVNELLDSIRGLPDQIAG